MIDHEITLRRKERYRKNNITMKLERIKEIQKETAYPDSISVQQALLKVWNECQQTLTDESDCSRIHYESNKDAEPLEESEWISVKDRMPPLHKEGNLPIVEILGEDNVTMEGYYCHIFGLWMTTHDTIVKVTHWKYRNK